MRDLSVNRRQPVLLLPKAAALLIYSEAVTSHCLGCGVVTSAQMCLCRAECPHLKATSCRGRRRRG